MRCKVSPRLKGEQLEGKELWLNLQGNSSEQLIYGANLKTNCKKDRKCGSVIQVNRSEKKHDSTRLTAEQF